MASNCIWNPVCFRERLGVVQSHAEHLGSEQIFTLNHFYGISELHLAPKRPDYRGGCISEVDLYSKAYTGTRKGVLITEVVAFQRLGIAHYTHCKVYSQFM